MNNEYVIDVHGLVKKFGYKTAVDGVDLQMPQGQVWGFLGPNGSGKTTTIRMICGLLAISAGAGRCLGYDISENASQIKARTGYMTQHFSFWEDMTIRENLEFVARIYALPDQRERVETTLDDLGLAQRANQLAGALSGGWKQRLALAAVTMHEPELLLLDEPTAGVDPQARREFWDEIHRLSLAGMTILVSTHYMDEAERCDHIVYLANGKKVVEGSVEEIIQASGLKTLRAEGEETRSIAPILKGKPGVDHVAYYGAALHVSSRQPRVLKSTLEGLEQDHVRWIDVRPSLEDAFIALMDEAGADRRLHS
ncbi:MAG: ABC transporter ATP-binding protein [Congregibacter sp.]